MQLVIHAQSCPSPQALKSKTFHEWLICLLVVCFAGTRRVQQWGEGQPPPSNYQQPYGQPPLQQPQQQYQPQQQQQYSQQPEGQATYAQPPPPYQQQQPQPVYAQPYYQQQPQQQQQAFYGQPVTLGGPVPPQYQQQQPPPPYYAPQQQPQYVQQPQYMQQQQQPQYGGPAPSAPSPYSQPMYAQQQQQPQPVYYAQPVAARQGASQRVAGGGAACRKCGTVYPLPPGAHSWRCKQCSEMNNLHGDQCTVQ
jgi:hypothetical protein